jgi:hypothetical protein
MRLGEKGRVGAFINDIKEGKYDSLKRYLSGH